MALIDLLLPFPRKSPTAIKCVVPGAETEIFLDALTKESFTGAAEPTQHPVEDGADITDHVVIKPLVLSISGIITTTPLGDSSAVARTAGLSAGAAVVGSALGKFGKVAGLAGDIAGGAIGKSIASAIFGAEKKRELFTFIDMFTDLRDSCQIVSITTGLKKYESFVLSSFTISRDDKTGRMVKVDLEFKEVLKVSSRKLTNNEIPKVIGAIRKKNLGRQSTKNFADSGGKGASLLKQGFGAFLGGRS